MSAQEEIEDLQSFIGNEEWVIAECKIAIASLQEKKVMAEKRRDLFKEKLAAELSQVKA